MHDELVHIHLNGRVAHVQMARPPANALTPQMRAALMSALETAQQDTAVDAIVLESTGRAFCKGVRLEDLGREVETAQGNAPSEAPDLGQLVQAIGQGAKPVVAAISGVAMGEGVALALAAHGRVFGTHGHFVFSDLANGMVPGGGVTQRLPRLVGVEKALDLILNSAVVSGPNARACGLTTRTVDGNPRPAAGALALELAATPQQWRLWPDEAAGMGDWQAASKAISAARRGFEGTPLLAAQQTVSCVEAALILPFEAGVARESVSRLDSFRSPQGAALRHLQLAERRTSQPKIKPENKPEGNTIEPRRIGISGAGPLTVGFTLTALDAGFHVQVNAPHAADADKMRQQINTAYEEAAARHILSEKQADDRKSHLEIGQDYKGLAQCDVVIDATTGNVATRRAALVALETTLPADIAVASISDAGIAQTVEALSHPDRFCVAHLLTPVQAVRIVEVARVPQTSDTTYLSVHRVFSRMGKVVASLSAQDGLVANRLHNAGMAAVDVMLLLGARPSQLDNALVKFGYSLGPCAQLDRIGLEHIDGTVARMLASSKLPGFYDDTGSDTAATAIITQMREAAGITPATFSDAEIVARFVLAQTNAGARLLEEGLVENAHEIDTIMVLGKGFPSKAGGPMFWSDRLTALQSEKALRVYAKSAPEIWQPAEYFHRLIKSGERFNNQT